MLLLTTLSVSGPAISCSAMFVALGPDMVLLTARMRDNYMMSIATTYANMLVAYALSLLILTVQEPKGDFGLLLLYVLLLCVWAFLVATEF